MNPPSAYWLLMQVRAVGTTDFQSLHKTRFALIARLWELGFGGISAAE
jgi:hypothetical protein